MQQNFYKNKGELLFALATKFKWAFLGIIAIQILVGLLNAVIPYITKLQIDYLQEKHSVYFPYIDNSAITILVILFIAPVAIETFRLFAFERLLRVLISKSTLQLRLFLEKYIWDKLETLDWGFFENRKNQRLLSIVLQSSSFGQDALQFFSSRVLDVTSIVAIIPLLSIVDIRILGFVFIAAIFQAVITQIASRQEAFYRVVQEKQEDDFWKIEALVRYEYHQLRLLGVTDRFLQIYRENGKEQNMFRLRWDTSRFNFQSYEFLIRNFLTFGVSLFIGLQVIEGKMSIGTFTLVTSYTLQLTRTFSNILDSLKDWRELELLYDRLSFVFLITPRITTQADAIKKIDNPKTITLNKVHFTYPDLRSEEKAYLATIVAKTKGFISKYFMRQYKWEIEAWEEALKEDKDKKPVLNGVNLSIQKGKMVALLGRNGAGKTTITNLILHGLEPTSGVISIESIPINKIDDRELLSQFSIIQQSPFFLWRFSIRENLTVGMNNTPSDKAIWKTLKEVGLDGVVKNLPKKLDTIIGEDYSLSGGQQQLIVIARLFLQNRNFIIFDEGTNQLDVENESKIFQKLKSLTKDSGILYITHRITTARKADYIYMLDEGKVVEEGTHHELLNKKDGLYKKFWNMQVIE